ncbi:hypothetical protein KDA23_03865 [Candidatus Saccharibacteria bacterium]|nr:hypothetical protein [Candidatus Saccharibacteria bacterium]
MGGIIVVAILLLVGLNGAHGTPSSTTVNKHTLAEAYLQKKQDDYGKCARSVEYGDSVITDVVIDNTYYGITQAEVKHLDRLADNFKAQVKKQCEKPIAEYEQNYATYKQTEQQIAKDTQSLFSKMLGNEPEVDDMALRQYDPKTIKLTGGDPLSDFVFTKADVEQYFAEHS